ncbi:hypothetical protein ONT17_03315 [Prevotella copri]|uniref:hypothetical protein n=1 Tax=Segatella copri TaxID=165179 RepID=UPI0022315953|nr:hypothetical protein [Segatella copri]MCW4117781.1 hypothetical protein [Segatella copri]
MIDKNPLQEKSNKLPLAGLFYIPTHFTHSLRSPFSPYALKGQKLLAQGIALGLYCRKLVAL